MTTLACREARSAHPYGEHPLFAEFPTSEAPAPPSESAQAVAEENCYVHAVDCRAGILSIPECSVSLVLTDPPYFIDGMGDEWNHSRLRGRVKGGVVGSLPAGMKFDPRQGIRLQAFLEPLAKQLMRVIKPGGFFLCFSQPRLSHRTAIAIESAGFEIRDLLAWQYSGQAKAFSQEHFVRKMALSDEEKSEIIRKLGGRKTPQLRPQMEMVVLAQAPRSGTFIENWLEHETGLIDVSDPVIQPSMFPGTLMPTPKPRERHNHITTKPVDLCRHLIRIFSAQGSIVLDPFAGCGTSGVAALAEGREFIGFEIDEPMAAIANERLRLGK